MNGRLRAMAGAAALVLAAGPAAAQGATEAWRLGGFKTPESASYDPASGTLFVSNINSPDMSANGQGYISQVSLDGKLLKERFAEGLNAPKGTEIHDGHLFVAGVGELVEIDLANGQVVKRYPAAGANFLNDVAFAPDGRGFVSETAQGAIYVLENGTLSQWIKDPRLAGANGLLVQGGELRVATLGDISRGFEHLTPSNVKSVNLATKAITDFGSAAPIGGLDGIEAMGDGVVVTDNPGGRIVRVGPDGKTEVLATPGPGAADLEYIPDQGLFVVPMLQGNEVVAYKASR